MRVFIPDIDTAKSDIDTAKILQPIVSGKITKNPTIILQMKRSTTKVFEAVQKTRRRVLSGLKTLGYASCF